MYTLAGHLRCRCYMGFTSSPAGSSGVGRSLGGLLALKLAESLDPIAVVAITPAPCRGLFALRTWHLLKTTVRHLHEIFGSRPIMPKFKEAVELELGCLPERDQEGVFSRMLPESGRVAREIAVTGVPMDASRVRRPLLLVGAVEDGITPKKMVRHMARKFKADYRRYQRRGHMVLLEPGWERMAEDMAECLAGVGGRPGAGT